MKMIYEKAIEVSNGLMLNVDEHKDDIKDCKEQCDINYEDGVQEIKMLETQLKRLRLCI